MQPILDDLGVRLSHLALAWCLRNGRVASVIIAASHPEQVADNIACLRVLPLLTHDVMMHIDMALRNKPSIDRLHQR